LRASFGGFFAAQDRETFDTTGYLPIGCAATTQLAHLRISAILAQGEDAPAALAYLNSRHPPICSIVNERLRAAALASQPKVAAFSR
jgi:hypothetical protein